MNYKLKVGKKILPFVCKSIINGEVIDLYNIKKPIFIYFWSINCIYSIDEMVTINNFIIEKYKDKIDFIFINCGDNINDLNDYFNKNKSKIPLKDIKTNMICNDNGDYIVNLLNVEDIPLGLIIDKDLVIKNIFIGKNRSDKYTNSLDNIFEVSVSQIKSK